MLDKQMEISFPTYYLTEFFSKTLESGADKVPEDQYDLLQDLGALFTLNPDVMEALEKLAQYQGTNELSIFLFDLSERLQEFPAQKSIEAMLNLVEDFINLFRLMMEENESVRDLGSVLDYFRAQKPLKELPVAEETESAVLEEEAVNEETLSFSEFYFRECAQIEEQILSPFEPEDRKTFHSFLSILRSFTPKEGETYHPEINLLYQQTQILYSTPTAEKYNALDTNFKHLLNQIQSFKDSELNMFNRIMEDSSIEPEQEQEKPLTVDDLLEDYFLSVVDDHKQQIQNALGILKEEGSFEPLLKTLRSLKELSMIHGYAGIESLAEQILFSLASAHDKGLIFTESTQQLFDEIIPEFSALEKYKNSDQTEAIQSMADRLLGTFKHEEKNADETEPTEKVKAEADRTISFTDQSVLLSVLKDSVRAVFLQIQTLHANFNQTEAQEQLFKMIRRVQGACSLMQINPAVHFLNKVQDYYLQLTSSEISLQLSGLEQLEKVWADLIETLSPDMDTKTLETALEAGTEPGFSIGDDDKIRKALGDVLRDRWKVLQTTFGKVYADNDASQKEEITHFLTGIRENAKLVSYDGLVIVIEYFKDLLEKNISFGQELSNEIQKSFELMLDRLQTVGKEADYSDLIEIMDEVLTPEETDRSIPEEEKDVSIEETKKPEEPESEEISEEEELEQDFIRESKENLEQVRLALQDIQADSTDRTPFKSIESSIHAIRSSAHLLQKDKISDFAVSIEEAAEMYEAEEMPLPETLVEVLSQSANILEQLILGKDVDTSEVETKIDNLLNALISEDIPESTVLEPEEAVEELATDEKPLFADDDDFDEELLDIFREESATFIAALNDSNLKLKEDLKDEKALNNLEYAAHSLRSSAKMLSFQEITQLTAGLENVVEAIKDGVIDNNIDIQNDIEQTIDMIQRLRDGEEIDSAELSAVVQLLDVTSHIEEPEEQLHTLDKESMTNVFLDEANEILEELNKNLLELENMPESALLLNEVLRHLHTLKGSAMMVEYTKIGNLAHKLEDYFQMYKEKDSDTKQEMLTPAFTAMDLLQEMCQSIGEGQGEEAKRFTAKLAELDNKLFYYQNFDQVITANQSESGTPTEPPKSMAARKDKKIIKIDTGYLDNLVNMATELVVNRTELTTHFDNFKKMLTDIENGKKQLHQIQNLLEDLIEEETSGTEPIEETTLNEDNEEKQNLEHVTENFKEITNVINNVTSEMTYLSQDFEKNIQQISNLSKTLHNDILRVRMVPVEYLFDRFPRAIRDLAKSQGKRVTVSVEGNNAEMDRAMIEALADPVMHILRNAVDHGIEDGDTRKQNNKPKIGKIVLSARQEKSQVIIDITDDGKGIDLDTVKKTAIKRGLVTKKEAAKLSEAEILDFIFYPEFSTKTKATQVSGRGVGLDVVANQIQKLKGVIRIHTEKGLGTTFSIRVPLTLIISQALMTRIHNHAIAIPLIAVQESQEIDPSEILMDDNRRYVQAHGKLLPYVPLSEILDFGDDVKNEEESKNVLILHDAGISVALGIGNITGRQEIVIKALGKALQNIEYIAGGTILGNGEVALILDYASVIRSVETQFFGHVRGRNSLKNMFSRKKAPGRAKLQIEKSSTVSGNSINQKTIKGRKPRVLIVDDSNSVRSFVGGVLDKNGYVCIRATDGLEALEILKKETIDLMITDLEMPNMDGFSLISEVRSNPDNEDLPIVILTGRSGKAQREKGAKLGANSFIGKPFKEGDLVKVVKDFVTT